MKKIFLKIFWWLGSNGFLKFISDEKYIAIIWYCIFNSKINYKNPKSFNEKLQCLKISNRKDEYTTMVDKYLVKEYISNKINNDIIIKTLWVGDNPEDIPYESLPEKFVIKCNHGSHCNIIVKDKNNINKKRINKNLKKWLKRNWFWYGREWPYKNVKPIILIEEYMEDNKYNELRDYKIYAFNGKCDYVMVCFDRYIDETKFIYFDRKWICKKEMSYDGLKYYDKINIDKPKNLDKMFEYASILSKGIPFLRVDFYEVNGKLYFGELTFYPSSGFDKDRTIECQNYLNKKLKIK